MFLTDETMDEFGAAYDEVRYAVIDGIETIERFVSESDYYRPTECDHAFGYWTNHGSVEYGIVATFECTECNYVREVQVRL